MRPTRLFLIRHGQTGGNVLEGDPPLTGRVDLPLTEEGRRQAGALATALAAEPLEAVYTSPLRRARNTARAIADGREAHLVVTAGLQEIDCGTLDGEPISRVREAYPDYWRRNEAQEEDGFRWPGGESYEELRARVLTALQEIALAHGGGTVAAVTHAGPVTQILGALRGRPPRVWKDDRPANGTITELSWSLGCRRLVRFGVQPADWPPGRASEPP